MIKTYVTAKCSSSKQRAEPKWEELQQSTEKHTYIRPLASIYYLFVETLSLNGEI